MRAISEGLRQEAGETLRVAFITPGFAHTEFVAAITDPAWRGQLEASRDKFAITPDAIAHAIAFAIEQPLGIDGGEIVIRPTAER